MGPHDLLCKWCSTFVGKGKKFCSIFCESRYTRSKRRKLAFKRPVHSSGPHTDKDYESPRSNKTAPTRKETFLEDVITAIENEKPSPERDKRPDGDTITTLPDKPPTNPSEHTDRPPTNQKKDSPSTTVPKLDLSSPKATLNIEKRKASAREKHDNKLTKDKEKNEKTKELRKQSAPISKPRETNSIENARSKTQTLLVHKVDSKIPVRNRTLGHGKGDDLNKTEPLPKTSALDESIKSDLKAKRLTLLNDKKKSETGKDATDADVLSQSVQRQKTKTAIELEKKIRSSGYGNPVNPRLRPMALKPRSATIAGSVAKITRESSARSSKSTMDVSSISNEDVRPINSGRKGKWELIPTTIKEEESKQENRNVNTSLEDEDPTPRTSQTNSARKSENTRDSQRNTSRKTDSTRELAKIHEILREESTHSDLLSKTELQIRLSSIKRKVEVRKRGSNSRSSFGSDLDSSFQDSVNDLTTDRDLLNTSRDNKMSKTSRTARSNITRISKQFQPLKVE